MRRQDQSTQSIAEPDVPGDAGTTRRVMRRTTAATGIAGAITILLAVLGFLAPGWFVGLVGASIGGCAIALCAAGTVVLARRTALWSRAARLARALADGHATGGTVTDAIGLRGPGATARCGEPIRLHRPGAGLQMWSRRRLPTQLLPVRADSGPLASGRAVIVHPRPDSLLPGPGDSIEIHAMGRRGPFLILRPDDGAVFAADCWVLSVA